MLPPIEKYELAPGKWVEVVRCDLIPGGFKRLAIDGVYIKAKANTLVFATNSRGAGALALTLSLQNSGKKLVLFLSERDTKSASLSECERLGAELDFSGKAEPLDSDGLRQEALEKYNGSDYEVLPLGLGSEVVASNMTRLAQEIFSSKTPREIWIAAASGLTVRSLQKALLATNFHAVLVKGNKPDIGNADSYVPEETFTEQAKILPPYPSNVYYDAKVWEILRNERSGDKFQEGIVVFNIA